MTTETSVKAGESIRFRLRAATSALHRETEQVMDLERRASTKAGYRDLVARLYGFYAPLEVALRSIDWPSGFDAQARLGKTAWLQDDLAQLDMSDAQMAALPMCATPTRATQCAEGLGVLYVVEGATLGGQVIKRILEEGLGIEPDSGGRFFSSYGLSIGVMWRSFAAELERHGAEAQAIEAAAAATFSSFGAWLCPLGTA